MQIEDLGTRGLQSHHFFSGTEIMSNWWKALQRGVSRRTDRRKPIQNPFSRVEDLEGRVVLSRGSLVPTGSDAPALVAVESEADAPPANVAARSGDFDVPAGARKKDKVIDIKQWQGTWNVTTDIPFLGGGTMQIRQLSATKFEATTTGMGGNQFYAVKLQGDDQLHFKIKGTDFEGKPKVVGFLVALNQTTLSSFQGIAKVAGGSHPHSISATLQNGTAPTTADVQPLLLRPGTDVGVGVYDLDVAITNYGTAALPPGAVKLEVTFTGNFTVADFQSSFQEQFTSVTPSLVDGKLVITCIADGFTSKRGAIGVVLLHVNVNSNFSVVATVSDNNLGANPAIPTVSTEVVQVTVG